MADDRAMTREEFRVNVLDRLCGCGSPEVACAALLRLLRLHPLYDHVEELNAWIDDDGVRHLLLYFLHDLGLTDHGGTVWGAWLSPKGQAALAALEREEDDDFMALSSGSWCGHGYDFDDGSHKCTVAEPVRWERNGLPMGAEENG